MNIQPVILSGGSGSRLWPLSREHYPKQLLPLVTSQTLIQETVNRIENLSEDSECSPDTRVLAPIVVCNEEHRFFIAEQLRQIDHEANKIILEPIGRNTAPALTLAALAVREQDADAALLVMPADHVIQDTKRFHHAIETGLKLVESGYLVTFGIKPDSPETGYGYIQKGEPIELAGEHDEQPVLIKQFVEKPELTTAQDYLASGDYLWNSGMFMLKAGDWLDAIQQLHPDIYQQCELAFSQGEDDRDFYRVDVEAFKACPNDSIDYAVMEKITDSASASAYSAAMVPMDAGWSDVGVWSTLWDVVEKDTQGNVTKGDVYTHDTRDSLIYSSQRHVASVGMDNVIIVETADAILVADKNKAQDVKQIVNRLKSNNREEYQKHRNVFRPWGAYECIDLGERYQVKRITVKPGAALSLQLHHHRAEHWVVVKGTAHVTRGEEVFLVSENESTFIPLGTKHRLENRGSIPLEMIEVQSGSYLGEDDIVRFDDMYGREKK